MEKVILTKDQAKAIESWKYGEERRSVLLKLRADEMLDNSKCLHELSLDEVARALYVGYEVEPEYKPGDWVVNSRGRIGYIREITDDGHYVGEWFGIDASVQMYCRPYAFDRHATPEEIAEVKERAWWKGHGREVWELKSGDILRRREGKMVEYVAKAQGEEVWFEYRGLPDTLDYVRKNCYVACFAENRLDVKINE